MSRAERAEGKQRREGEPRRSRQEKKEGDGDPLQETNRGLRITKYFLLQF
jgi:hypothetical protein